MNRTDSPATSHDTGMGWVGCWVRVIGCKDLLLAISLD
jgi:hypothetical protein